MPDRPTPAERVRAARLELENVLRELAYGFHPAGVRLAVALIDIHQAERLLVGDAETTNEAERSSP